MTYEEFVERKRRARLAMGFAPHEIPDAAFDFQRHIITQACCAGRYAIYADCGMGKTLMQLAWANNVVMHTGGSVLLLTPLSVAHQTVDEGRKFGIPSTYDRDGAKHTGIVVTNYEHAHKFSPSDFDGIVVDESSIMKSFDGKYRRMITDFASRIHYRLACSATPAPNDFMEYGTQSEFLGVLPHVEMLATYFVHDGGDTSKWRLKRHAVRDFHDWLSTWACHVTKPSDLGYSDDGFVLPKLHEYDHRIESDEAASALFEDVKLSLADQRRLKKRVYQDVADAITRLTGDGHQWIVWIENNYEGDTLASMIPSSVEVRGSDTPEQKEERLEAFARGDIRVMITKPSIAGFGLNWQHCSRMVFASPSHSYEQYYQAVRRCYRFGQTEPVHVYRIRYSGDEAIAKNMDRKKEQASQIRKVATV